jgi:hypothetical protein
MNDPDLYPNGREFYYEGSTPMLFVMHATGNGFDVNISVHVPADRLEEFQHLIEITKHPVGT